MQFMQTAVQKVKSFDFDSPFGNTVTFNHTITKPATGIEEVIIDIDNGKVTYPYMMKWKKYVRNSL